MTTFNQKLTISMNSALLFGLINLPQVYKLTDNLLPQNLYNHMISCPTNMGLIVHTIIFFVLTFLSMGILKENIGIKLKHTIYGTLIFYLISSPAFFSFVGSILGQQFSNANGCPTLLGVGLHSLVYCAILVAVMYLPEKNN